MSTTTYSTTTTTGFGTEVTDFPVGAPVAGDILFFVRKGVAGAANQGFQIGYSALVEAIQAAVAGGTVPTGAITDPNSGATITDPITGLPILGAPRTLTDPLTGIPITDPINHQTIGAI